MVAVSGNDSDLTAELQRLQLGIDPATLANPFGPVTAAGVIRSVPDDFRVTELPLDFPAAGGEHCWLLIRKTGQNTAWVAKQLAVYAGFTGPMYRRQSGLTPSGSEQRGTGITLSLSRWA